PTAALQWRSQLAARVPAASEREDGDAIAVAHRPEARRARLPLAGPGVIVAGDLAGGLGGFSVRVLERLPRAGDWFPRQRRRLRILLARNQDGAAAVILNRPHARLEQRRLAAGEVAVEELLADADAVRAVEGSVL